MIRFRNIVVSQDAHQKPSEGLRWAARLALRSQGQVKLVDVEHESSWLWREFVAETKQLSGITPEIRHENLRKLALESGLTDSMIQTRVLSGRPFRELILEAVSGGHDLLVKEASCESDCIFLGGLDMRLLRNSPIPILIASPSPPRETMRVLAAIDPEVDPKKTEQNIDIIRVASAICKAENAELYVIAAWKSPSFAFATDGDYEKRYEAYRGGVLRKVWESLEHVLNLSLCRVPKDRVILKDCNASDAIVETVDDLHPDLLVMGTHTRNRIVGILIGNTAESALRQVDCSVLVLKPDGRVESCLHRLELEPA